MFFLNLTAGEFLALLGVLGGVIASLYLLDRTRRKKVVSTLRFWNSAFAAEQQQSRKRVREPWSLVLQLVSLLFLLLAIAQLQWGSREGRGRDHVILLDTSFWAAQEGSGGTVLEREKRAARQYLASLPVRDRVMLVRADALAAPATPFTADRPQLLRAISESGSSFSALNILQALSFARQARTWSGGQGGEIVYVGPKLVENASSENTSIGARAAGLRLEGLRIISVPASRQNIGIRGITVKRGEDEENSWQATVTLKNYGSERRLIRVRAQFAGTVFAPRPLSLRPGQEAEAAYSFTTNTSGRFIAAIDPHDALPSDDQASLELPGSGLLSIVAFTSRPNVLRPLLEADRHLSIKLLSPAAYALKPRCDIMLLDRFAPPDQPSPGSPKANRLPVPSLWIDPPQDGSPLPVKSVVNDAVINTWTADTDLGAGLHAKGTRIGRADIFQLFEGDQSVAGASEGPVVVVRPATNAGPKTAAIGFDPLSGPMRFDVTAPLLFANLLRWLSPDSFRTLEITAGRVGTATVFLDRNENTRSLHATDENGMAVPFTVRHQTLELFTSRPSIVRVLSDDRDRVLSLTLPQVAESDWNPTENIATGIPPAHSFAPASADLWRWLALLGGAGLLTEWLLFGRRRFMNWGAAPSVSTHPLNPERSRELVPR